MFDSDPAEGFLQTHKEVWRCEDRNPSRFTSGLPIWKSFSSGSGTARQSSEWPVGLGLSSWLHRGSTPARSQSAWGVEIGRCNVSEIGLPGKGSTACSIDPVPAPRVDFPPLVRTQIQALACTPPASKGLSLTHWSSRDLVLQIQKDGITTSIHFTTVHLILKESELQPHRFRYWINLTDPDFVRKAVPILWLYERALSLHKQGILVACTDEKPSLQVLERRFPTLPMRPGQIERHEFEYIRHGTVNLSATFHVATGTAYGRCLPQNSRTYFIETLDRHAWRNREFTRIEYILDNGPSHDHPDVRQWAKDQKGKVRLHFLPFHASWLNQAEIFLRLFTRRYIRRGSWENPRIMKRHLRRAFTEHNHRYARPFDWSFTRKAMRNWHQEISAKTCPTHH